VRRFSDLTRLFATEAPKLRRFLSRFAPSVSAEDIAQESFLKLCAAEPGDIASPRAYLFTTARNLALDNIRRQRTVMVETIADMETVVATEAAASPEEALVRAEDEAALARAVAALPALEREALVLRRVDRLPPDEVARRLGVTPRTMQRLIERAIARCHAHLRARAESDVKSASRAAIE
jgi:RNA polymerase sigma-70 factor (ECF subfamily)